MPAPKTRHPAPLAPLTVEASDLLGTKPPASRKVAIASPVAANAPEQAVNLADVEKKALEVVRKSKVAALSAPPTAAPPAPEPKQMTAEDFAKKMFPYEPDAEGAYLIPIAHYPPDLSAVKGCEKFGVLTSVRVTRAVFGKLRQAARMYPENATGQDQDVCILSVLTGVPTVGLDLVDSRDMTVLRTALGKLLYSVPM
jgi:hypothetical protein